MSENRETMAYKREKLTYSKTRERILSLEESISTRQHRLNQLNLRLERSDSADERVLEAKARLEQRIQLEFDQLNKLNRLLRSSANRAEASSEYVISQELDEVHRSFEEVRQGLTQIQSRMDSVETPRELVNRVSSFEDRLARREEVASELSSSILAVKASADQERQFLRRLQRSVREQGQSLEALREAVEDSVVATVDLAKRLEEIEDSISDCAAGQESRGRSSRELESTHKLVEPLQLELQSLDARLAEGLEKAAVERAKLFKEQQNLQVLSNNFRQEMNSVSLEATKEELLIELAKRIDIIESELGSIRTTATAPAELSQASYRQAVFSLTCPAAQRPAKFAAAAMRKR